MPAAALTSRKTIVWTTCGLLIAGAAAWEAIRAGHSSRHASGLPPELSVASLKSMDAEQVEETIERALQSADLTEQQRSDLIANGKRAIEQRNQERVDEYFACRNPEEQTKMLDRRIDEIEASRKR